MTICHELSGLRGLAPSPPFSVLPTASCSHVKSIAQTHYCYSHSLVLTNPTKSHSGNVRETLALNTLNGDVLHEIASYLRGRDALNLSLTARRIHDFVVHRVVSCILCRTPSGLRRVYDYVLAGQPKRAVHVRSLTILGTTFIQRPWQEDPNWVFPETTYEYSLAPVIGDILGAAQGITHLYIEHFASLLANQPSIASAIATMSGLVNLQLCHIDSHALVIFQHMQSRPRHLRFSTIKAKTPMEARHVLNFVHDILDAVSSIQELTVIDLDLSGISCRPFRVPLEPRDNLVPLPFVRRLAVHWFSHIVDVAALFPNLEILEQHINSFHIARPSGISLRRLSITELRAQGSIVLPVHMLHLRRYPRDVQSFLRTVGDLSPVGISLHSFIDIPRCWEQLSSVALRLRFIDVQCHTWDRCPTAGWVRKFLERLHNYSLVCLRIVAPLPPIPGEDNMPWAEEDIQALAELPDILPQVVPSLRYVAWAAKSSISSEYKWYEDEYDAACAEYTWYKVVDGGEDDEKKKNLQTISAEEGERVRRFLLGSDFEKISKIDEHFTLQPACALQR